MEDQVNIEEILLFNVAILISCRTPVLDSLVDELYFDLQSLLQSNKRFKLITVRKRYIVKSADVQLLLKSWENENLIIYVGEPSLCVYKNDFSKDTKLKIRSNGPFLTNLLFKNENSCSKRFNCFLNGNGLVYQFPWSLTSYMDFIKVKFLFLLSAILEIKKLNLHCDLQITDSNCSFIHKSDVSFISPICRPRESLYDMISVKKAIKHVLHEAFVLSTEVKSVKDCLSFVLADSIKATEPYPPFDASIKDGYAVIASDPVFDGPGPFILSVIGNTETGHVPEFKIIPGTCARVSTGGVIPEFSDAVVQVEDTCIHKSHEDEEVSIEILKKPTKLQDIRVQGTDVSKECVVIPARHKVTAAEIGIMSIFGISHVLVYKKPWVALMSTGDEVIEAGHPIRPGCIRDSNKSMLSQILIENNIPFVDVGIAKDNPHIMKSHLMLALSAADIVISTGGVSMGEKDIMKLVLEKDFNASIHFGRVHMKPGKPTTFSTIIIDGEKKLIFSLPGNPVSACVCFYLFVMPCIRKMSGHIDAEHKLIKVKLRKDIELDARPEFCRVFLTCDIDGIFAAETTGSQQSSRLLSMQNADALLVLPPKTEDLKIMKAGTLVDAISLKCV